MQNRELIAFFSKFAIFNCTKLLKSSFFKKKIAYEISKLKWVIIKEETFKIYKKTHILNKDYYSFQQFYCFHG